MYEFKAKIKNVELATNLMHVLSELENAKIKHPEFPQDNVKRAAIMMEEAGEAIREANHFDEGRGDLDQFKIELCQTAAMCLRTLESLSIEANIKEG